MSTVARMTFFLRHGYRVIAHDRRGHGRSDQASTGNDMDHWVADLAALTEQLDLRDAIHIRRFQAQRSRR
jgi:pimeloyl-ACP methyl ester carboxylesterase